MLPFTSICQAELVKFRRKLEAARNPRASEAQRFYRLGEKRREEGDDIGAVKQWRELIRAFDQVPTELEWVALARDRIAEATSPEAQAALLG